MWESGWSPEKKKYCCYTEMEFMGAKDALCKIADMSIGLEDTLAYYDPTVFTEGFKKTMAFQPRVLKQNRGSSGEGIWIIKLKD
jgi:hypothetical protein